MSATGPGKNDADSLIAEIRESFSNLASPPGDDDITYTNDSRHLECCQVRELFSGRRWVSLSASFLVKNSFALSFFSAEAFHYFMPAFMVAALQDFDNSEFIPSSLLLRISIDHSVDFPSPLRRLTIAQLASLVDFIAWVKKYRADEFFLYQIQPAENEVLAQLNRLRGPQTEKS